MCVCVCAHCSMSCAPPHPKPLKISQTSFHMGQAFGIVSSGLNRKHTQQTHSHWPVCWPHLSKQNKAPWLMQLVRTTSVQTIRISAQSKCPYYGPELFLKAEETNRTELQVSHLQPKWIVCLSSGCGCHFLCEVTDGKEAGEFSGVWKNIV